MRFLLLLLLLLAVLAAGVANAHVDCHVEELSQTEQQRDDRRMRQLQEQLQEQHDHRRLRSSIAIEVIFHIIGTTEWSSSAIDRQMELLNQAFSQTPFAFTLKDTTRTSNRNDWAQGFPSDSLQDEITASLRSGGGDVANIFVTPGTCQLASGTAIYPRDFGFFPPDTFTREDRIFLCADVVNDGDEIHILAHEMGHWLGLLHTFEGEDCGGDGDKVDDTLPQERQTGPNICPAPFNDESCRTRQTHNMMDYVACRRDFTEGQNNRMVEQFELYRRRSTGSCSSGSTHVNFKVKFDESPGENQIGFATYEGGDQDWTDLKVLDSEPQIDYAGQTLERNMCIPSSQQLYSFTVRDVAKNGFSGSGYASLSIDGDEVERLTDFENEYAATFVVADSCNDNQDLFLLDLSLWGFAKDFEWSIDQLDPRQSIVESISTRGYMQHVYRRLLYQKCLDKGENYQFSLRDTQNDQMGNMRSYSVSVGGNVVKTVDGSFRSPESTTFETSPVAPTVAPTTGLGPICFAGSGKVDVKGKGVVEMNVLQIGDHVHVGNGSYEQVYSFGHYSLESVGSYLRLDTDEKSSLLISKDHMVFTPDRGAVPAGVLRVGEQLLHESGEAVTIKSIVKEEDVPGVFAPFTKSGQIVVDGMVSSCFVAFGPSSSIRIAPGIDVSYQWLAQTFMYPRYLYCSWFGGCTYEVYNDEGINVWVAAPYRFFRWMLEE